MCMYIYTVCERKGEGVQGERNKDTRLSVCLCYVPPPVVSPFQIEREREE